MTERLGRKMVLFLFLFLAASSLLAENIKNWAAPATWSPPKSRGGLSTQDLTNPLPFIALAPCRILDTRGNGAPIQGGIFTGGADVRSYAVAGICGIPSSAHALSLNFTVTGPGQNMAGFLVAWPTGGAFPPVSSLNWDHVPATVGNAAVVPTNTSTSFTVTVSAPTHVIIDVNGYYYDGTSLSLPTGEQFRIIANIAGGGSIYGQNTNATGFGVWGAAVAGQGVFGTSVTSAGVYGLSTGGNGVFGSSSLGGIAGVLGTNSASADGTHGVGGFAGGAARVYGVQGHISSAATAGSAGVHGIGDASAAGTFGVLGTSSSGWPASAGVFGQDFSAYNPGLELGPSGVAGNSQDNYGVLGQSRYVGVYGQLRSSTDALSVFGLLGTTFGSVPNPVFPFIPFVGPWAVFAGGNFGATGAKHFVEPHPTDAKKLILYSSLEGREVGTYFRGTASIVNHEAVIVIPEDFRTVTAEEGLTVQVTPIGAYSQVYVESQDLNQIVIRGSQDVQFHYMVNGVRRAFKNFEPVQTGYVFMPQSASDRIPAYLTEEAKRRLISNGTYNEDGTVNMSTAEKAGFTKIWADAAAEKAAAARAAQGEKQQ